MAHELKMIEPMLVVSTAHVPEAFSKVAQHAARFTRDTGWIFHTWQADPMHGLPPEVRAILDFAKGKGCQWVMFDADAEALDLWPTFEW